MLTHESKSLEEKYKLFVEYCKQLQVANKLPKRDRVKVEQQMAEKIDWNTLGVRKVYDSVSGAFSLLIYFLLRGESKVDFGKNPGLQVRIDQDNFKKLQKAIKTTDDVMFEVVYPGESHARDVPFNALQSVFFKHLIPKSNQDNLLKEV